MRRAIASGAAAGLVLALALLGGASAPSSSRPACDTERVEALAGGLAWTRGYAVALPDDAPAAQRAQVTRNLVVTREALQEARERCS